MNIKDYVAHYAATWLLDPRAPKVDMPPELAQRIARMRAEAEKIKDCLLYTSRCV